MFERRLENFLHAPRTGSGSWLADFSNTIHHKNHGPHDLCATISPRLFAKFERRYAPPSNARLNDAPEPNWARKKGATAL
jgi:hypothetical protein